MAAAKAQLTKLDMQPRPEELPPSKAKVAAAQVNVLLQEDLAERAKKLKPSGAIPIEEATQRLLDAVSGAGA